MNMLYTPFAFNCHPALDAGSIEKDKMDTGSEAGMTEVVACTPFVFHMPFVLSLSKGECMVSLGFDKLSPNGN